MLGLAYAALAKGIGLLPAFGNPGSSVAVLWPGSALLLAALLWSPRREWPWLLAAAWAGDAAVDLTSHVNIVVRVWSGVGIVVEASLAAWLVQGSRTKRVDLSKRDELLLFFVYGALLGPLLRRSCS